MSAWHPDWPGFNARGSLLLPLPREQFADLAESIELDGLSLARKHEFHVTVFDHALGARVQAALAPRLPALFAALDWRWQRSGERWLLQESREGVLAHSVIELLDLPALQAFRDAAAQLLGEALPAVPAHVTLYTAGNEVGIGLCSHAEFESLRLRKL